MAVPEPMMAASNEAMNTSFRRIVSFLRNSFLFWITGVSEIPECGARIAQARKRLQVSRLRSGLKFSVSSLKSQARGSVSGLSFEIPDLEFQISAYLRSET